MAVQITKRFRIGVVLLLILVGACQSTRSVSDRDLVMIDRAEVEKLLREKPDKVLLVDPRPRRRFELGHLPGAVHITLQTVSLQDPRLDGYQTIIVYGDGWEDPYAITMSKRLLSLKYDVLTYEGGMVDWRANHPDRIEDARDPDPDSDVTAGGP